jgi:hypothetical protein
MATTKWLRVAAVATALLVLAAPAATADPGHEQVLPFKVVWSGTFDMFGEPDWCPEGWAPVHITATGNASHMGLVEVETWHCANRATDDLDYGVEVWTAANGDKLYGTYDGHLGPVTATHTYDGGTGRFANATGSLGPGSPWIVFTSETEGVIGGSLTGTISYDASDR